MAVFNPGDRVILTADWPDTVWREGLTVTVIEREFDGVIGTDEFVVVTDEGERGILHISEAELA